MKDDEVSLVEAMKAEIKAAHEALPFRRPTNPRTVFPFEYCVISRTSRSFASSRPN